MAKEANISIFSLDPSHDYISSVTVCRHVCVCISASLRHEKHEENSYNNTNTYECDCVAHARTYPHVFRDVEREMEVNSHVSTINISQNGTGVKEFVRVRRFCVHSSNDENKKELHFTSQTTGQRMQHIPLSTQLTISGDRKIS